VPGSSEKGKRLHKKRKKPTHKKPGTGKQHNYIFVFVFLFSAIFANFRKEIFSKFAGKFENENVRFKPYNENPRSRKTFNFSCFWLGAKSVKTKIVIN
jgi:hypothetical protein